MKFVQKELADKVGWTPVAISMWKKSHPDRFEILKLGFIAKELGLLEKDLEWLSSMKNEKDEKSS